MLFMTNSHVTMSGDPISNPGVEVRNTFAMHYDVVYPVALNILKVSSLTSVKTQTPQQECGMR